MRGIGDGDGLQDAIQLSQALRASVDQAHRARKTDWVVAAASTTGPRLLQLQHDGTVAVEPVRKRSAANGHGDGRGDDLIKALRRLSDVYALPEGWRMFDGRSVRVAVLDTGVDFEHPLLKSAIATQDGKPICRSFLSRELKAQGLRSADTEGIPAHAQDKDGHGTHTAGVIAARPPAGAEGSTAGFGFRGIAPEARLVIAKVLDDHGEGHVDDVADAIVWAASRADIINLSLDTQSSSDKLYRAICAALGAGCTIVCAAGNNGSLPGELSYPARYGGVIAVAAHDEFGRPVPFSSRGGEIDFAALGADVWSTWVRDGKPYLARASGTSIAAPVVSGIAALVLAKHRLFERFHDEAAAQLDATADPQRRRQLEDLMSVFRNNTPIRNNEDMRAHLMQLASFRGQHSNELGYGPLWLNRLLDS